jgi:hypothetical protein
MDDDEGPVEVPRHCAPAALRGPRFALQRKPRSPHGALLCVRKPPMIDKQRFLSIRNKHGGYASWAVWTAASGKPKSNIADTSIFDVEANASLLRILRNDVVMVGLNISRPFSEPFRNFHDPSPNANDFKIRYAFTNTDYYGAYMTDFIKNIEMVKSTDLLAHLKTHPNLIQQNANAFREELQDVTSSKPTILAFGSDTHRLIAENIPAGDYSALIKLTHYSHQIGKEKYRSTVLAQINARVTTHSGVSTDNVHARP